jgi:hypothetical protein
VQEDVCRNGSLGVNFNKAVDPSSIPPNPTTLDATVALFAAGSDCFTPAPTPPPPVSGILEKLFKKFASLFNIFPSRANGLSLCNDMELTSSASKVIINPIDEGNIFYDNRTYQLRIYGYKDDAFKGIKAQDENYLWAGTPASCGADMEAGLDGDKPYCYFEFTTLEDKGDINNNGICELDFVSVNHEPNLNDPNDTGEPGTELNLFSKADNIALTAQGYSGELWDFSQPIEPIDGVYAWTFESWREDPESDIIDLDQSVPSVAVQTTKEIGSDQTNIIVDVKLDPNNPIQSDPNIPIKPLLVNVRPCQGGGDMWWNFEDVKNSGNLTQLPNPPYVNFSFGYCQEQEGKQPLPRLSAQAVPLKKTSSRDILKEYFLRYQDPSAAGKAGNDVLLIRVFPAPDYFISSGDAKEPILEWYDAEESIFAETTDLSLQDPIDGYSAAQVIGGDKEASRVYVQVLNVDFDVDNNSANGNQPKIYNNIYVLAVNQGASKATRDIFNQLVENWHFNLNIKDNGTKSEIKIAKLKRDYQRIRDLSYLADKISGEFYPSLPDAKPSGIAVSAWGRGWRLSPSQLKDPEYEIRVRYSLPTALGINNMPLDPKDLLARDISSTEDAGAIKSIRDCLDSQKDWSALYGCLWGEGGAAILKCLAPGDFASTSTRKDDLEKLGLGYNPDDTVDPYEIFSCRDEEANNDNKKQEYYCRGQGSHVYQYEKQGDTFALYANLEYNDDEMTQAWCQGWDQYKCAAWSGGVAGFCEWFDDPNDDCAGKESLDCQANIFCVWKGDDGGCQKEYCRVKPVDQPECADAREEVNGVNLPVLPKDKGPFNIMFRP